eukprot:comp22149_c0_seq1/m.32444 comp22149_c0_seq1/g.32444  ORF comp22149_c0_seq1/g.32444 comp22149_c0_seq1/m.32444 type:complete len:281 (-) comp22149_c0_seq1:173-1015(-)
MPPKRKAAAAKEPPSKKAKTKDTPPEDINTKTTKRAATTKKNTAAAREKTPPAPKQTKSKTAPPKTSKRGAKENDNEAVVEEKKGGRKPAQKKPKKEESTAEEVSEPVAASSTDRYFLMKSEPDSHIINGQQLAMSFDDLRAKPNQTSHWDGVRNYQARNIMKEMKLGDQAFFYHSSCKEPGIAGIVEIVREAYVDPHQFDKNDYYYDAASTAEKPRWVMVDVKAVRPLKRFVGLKELRASPSPTVQSMVLLNRARLSVQRVKKEEWEHILQLENEEPPK